MLTRQGVTTSNAFLDGGTEKENFLPPFALQFVPIRKEGE
jgi:hypothetical protein